MGSRKPTATGLGAALPSQGPPPGAQQEAFDFRPKGKPGPKPRHPKPVQATFDFDHSECKGQGPLWFTQAERLAARGKREEDRARTALVDLGWTLVTRPADLWAWVAHSRRRQATVRAATSTGLLRRVREIETGKPDGQLDLLS
jgi:hypothetical protein